MIHFTSLDDFTETARNFYGTVSPGLMTGALMVELALHTMGRISSFHALCEIDRDLPRAVQLLTPCTEENGRLHVLDLDRFAVTLFSCQSGKGVLVYLDFAKTAGWPHIRRWIMRKDIDGGPDQVRLEHEIRKAGISVLSASSVRMPALLLRNGFPESMAACLSCGKACSERSTVLCLSAAGQSSREPELPSDVPFNQP